MLIKIFDDVRPCGRCGSTRILVTLLEGKEEGLMGDVLCYGCFLESRYVLDKKNRIGSNEEGHEYMKKAIQMWNEDTI